jgi:hypothetical protein
METTDTTTIHVRVPQHVVAQLRTMAVEQDRPLSSLVRRFLLAEAQRASSASSGKAA